jgi:hypothetical protein
MRGFLILCSFALAATTLHVVGADTGTASISGRVTGEPGVVLSGVGVELEGSGVSRYSSTGAHGRFRIGGLKAGRYRIEWHPSDRVTLFMIPESPRPRWTTVSPWDADRSRWIVLRPGARAILNAHLRLGRGVTGRVLTASGRPIYQACVHAFDRRGRIVARTMTEELGFYRLGIDMPAGVRASDCYLDRFGASWYRRGTLLSRGDHPAVDIELDRVPAPDVRLVRLSTRQVPGDPLRYRTTAVLRNFSVTGVSYFDFEVWVRIQSSVPPGNTYGGRGRHSIRLSAKGERRLSTIWKRPIHGTVEIGAHACLFRDRSRLDDARVSAMRFAGPLIEQDDPRPARAECIYWYG